MPIRIPLLIRRGLWGSSKDGGGLVHSGGKWFGVNPIQPAVGPGPSPRIFTTPENLADSQVKPETPFLPYLSINTEMSAHAVESLPSPGLDSFDFLQHGGGPATFDINKGFGFAGVNNSRPGYYAKASGMS